MKRQPKAEMNDHALIIIYGAQLGAALKAIKLTALDEWRVEAAAYILPDGYKIVKKHK